MTIFALVLEYVRRRFPDRARPFRRGQAEKLPVHALGLVEQLHGLRPHPVGRITR